MKDKTHLSKAKKFVFGFVMFVGVFAIAETIASVYFFFGLTQQEIDSAELVLGLRQSDSNEVLRYISHPYFNYVCNPDYVTLNGYKPHNSQGFRLPEWPETKEPETLRILAFGGSSTYGIFVVHEEDVWPARIKTKIRRPEYSKVEVFNLGVPSYTVHEIIGVLAMEAPSLLPDFVVIHVGANEAFSAPFPDEGGPDNTSFRYSWNHRPVPGPLKSAMRRSYFIRVLAWPLISGDGYSTTSLNEAMQFPPPADDEVIANSRAATGKYFRQNLRTLIALSRSIDATPILLTHPMHPGWNPQGVYFQSVIPAMLRNNEIIRDVGLENNVAVVDLWASMQEPVLFADGIHASEHGMDVKAALVAKRIDSLLSARREP